MTPPPHEVQRLVERLTICADLVLDMRCDEYRVIAAALQALQQRVEALERDVAYHADCRPNRKQAEHAFALAKATNDENADLKARVRALEQQVQEYRRMLLAEGLIPLDAEGAE